MRRVLPAAPALSDPVTPPDTDAAHGVADWPFRLRAPACPAALPDGRPWPRVRVLTPASGEEARLASGIASVARQGFDRCRHDLVAPGDAAETALAAILADASVDCVLVLRAGDLLAPGALAALCLEAVLSDAAAVAGLRVLYDRAPAGLDVPALSGPEPDDGAFDGILWSRRALADAGGLRLDGPSAARAWAALRRSGAGVSRIGRPVLLRHAPPPAEPALRPSGLSIAALTGTGPAGGAGIAHRRLGEALTLAGHRVADFVLTDESPAAAAEWTDAFPAIEAAIRTGGHDVVLAGNLHGATRSLDLVGRIAQSVPVALVLHDLFPLTGRCAHPRDCVRIEGPGCDAACPTPDEYPQLASARIAGAHAAKRRVLSGPAGPLLLANSAWTAERARALAPAGTAVAPVALAFPTGVFVPRDRRTLRGELGLPADDLLILVSAVVLDGPDKNVGDLLQALRRVARPGIGFVAVGRLDDPARLALPNLFPAGAVAEEARLAAWYGACDLHVTASRLETLGQTPIEAALCGTPTLAYRTAGLTTSVIDGVSGRLVPVAPGALADALEDLVADRPALARLGAFARIAFENRFSPAACAISLDAALRARGLVPDGPGRLRFGPAMLGHFPFAERRHPGAAGLVAPRAGVLLRRLRRAKQAVLGRRLPLWVRRGLYLAARVRSVAGSRR